MIQPQQLLDRLKAIGHSLARRGDALALIGLGSAGPERDRLDAYSDLDFFVIVGEGSKAAYLADLAWLSDVAPLAYWFQNTVDGYKALYADGVFCEFAVFESAELATIPFALGRIVWRAPGVSDEIAIPQHTSAPVDPPTTEWLLGEALTNLYVGLLRDRRGERLSAMRFIQGYAVDRVIDLVERTETSQTGSRDRFDRERRFEQRFPAVAASLPAMLPGYGANQDAARTILRFLDARFELNTAMRAAVLQLCEPT